MSFWKTSYAYTRWHDYAEQPLSSVRARLFTRRRQQRGSARHDDDDDDDYTGYTRPFGVFFFVLVCERVVPQAAAMRFAGYRGILMCSPKLAYTQTRELIL